MTNKKDDDFIESTAERVEDASKAVATSTGTTGKDLSLNTDKPVSERMAMIQMVENIAMNPEVDVAKMNAIIDMQQRMFTENARVEFNAAMNKVQKKIKPVIRTADNNQTSSKYAKLENIVKDISPIYTKEGFALSFGTDVVGSPELSVKGWFRCTCECTHSGGYSKTFHVDLPPDMTGIQGGVNKTPMHAFKSSVSYGRNILICMVFNIVTEGEDDDGNTGGGKAGAQKLTNKAADYCAALEECTTEKQLYAVFAEGFKALDGDGFGRNQLGKAKEAMKVKLNIK